MASRNQSLTTAQTRELRPIDEVKTLVANKAGEFKAVLPAHISIEKFQRTIATAALANPQLFECDRKSLLMASMKAAQDGLLPDGREAALVPFQVSYQQDGKWLKRWEVQYMPMAFGLRKKVLQSGEVISIETGVVYKAEVEDNFIYEIGMDPPIRYRPKLDLTAEEATDDNIVVAYSVARLKNPHEGGAPYWSVEVLRRFEIDKIRQMSQTGAVGREVKYGPKKGTPIAPKGPWVDWFPAMAEKTALRQHTKSLPMSGDLLDTLARDDEEESRANSAAKLLASAEPDAPLVIPGKDELDGADPVTGEVIDEATGNGLSDVDEETARKLDAGENAEEKSEDRLDAEAWVDRLIESFAEAKTDDDRRSLHEQSTKTLGDLEAQYPDLHTKVMEAIPPYVERPQTDFTGANKPETAQHGQSWFNPSDGKTKFAVLTQHGIKWYLQAPTEGPYVAPEPEKVEAEAEQDPAASDRQDEEEAEDVQQAAAETVAAIDGPLTEEQAADEPAEEEPLYMGKVRELHALLDAATNKTAVNKVEQEYLRHCVAFSKDVADGLEVKMMTLKRKFAAAAAEG